VTRPLPTATTRIFALLALLAILAPSDLWAQFGQRQRRRAPAPYRGVAIGARLGQEYDIDAWAVGGQLRATFDPWGAIELMPNGDVYFLRQGEGRDWQLNADAAVALLGIYVGGGLAFLNGRFEVDEPDETRTGYNLFAGLRAPLAPGRFGFQAEFRWSWVDDRKPRTVSIGLNYPLVLWR